MTSSLALARQRFAALVDDRVGIIHRVDVVRTGPQDPAVFVAYADPSSTHPLTGLKAANRGAAASLDWERAVVRACGESIERYCSAFFDLDSMPLATAEELRLTGVPSIGVNELYPFAPTQYRQQGFPFTAAAGLPQRWTLAQPVGNFVGQKPSWVPASCVYVPYRFDRAKEPFTHMPISTGLAAGETHDSCVDKGILEIIERDALMIRWYNWLPAARIPLETCTGRNDLLDQTLAAGHIGDARWHIGLITLDVPVPVITAALINEDGPPMTSMGVAAHQDPVRAVLLATEEALLTRVLLNRSSELASTQTEFEASTLRGHMLAHARSAKLREVLRFLTDPELKVPMDDVLAEFGNDKRTLAERLETIGACAWQVDITTKDVAAAGFRVARTVIPGFQPLDNDHRHRYLGGRRLNSMHPDSVYSEIPKRQFNPYPHPFP